MKLLLKPTCGLANRLRAIDSGVEFAKACGRRLIVYWYDTPDCHASWNDLFEKPSAFDVINVPKHEIGAYDSIFNKSNPSFIQPNPNVQVETDIMQGALSRTDENLALESYHRFFPVINYGWLRPAAVISDKISRLRAQLGNNLVGIHIRRSDMPIASLVSHTDLFIAQIRKELTADPGTRFFLATDDPDEKKRLQKLFPKVIASQERVSDRFDDRGIQDALIDLLLLSSCSKIFGTICSSFGAEAANIGHIEKITLEDKTRFAISFIVTIEPFSSPEDIRQCLYSLKNQWFARNEIICISDHSLPKEATDSIVNNSSNDSDFSIVSDLTNAIRDVRGKYFMFISSSEKANFHLAKRTFNAAESANADQIAFNPPLFRNATGESKKLHRKLNDLQRKWICWEFLDHRTIPSFLAKRLFSGCQQGWLAPCRLLYKTDSYKNYLCGIRRKWGFTTLGRTSFLNRCFISRDITTESYPIFTQAGKEFHTSPFYPFSAMSLCRLIHVFCKKRSF